MIGADLLVLLSDVDGLYTAPPGPGRDPTFVTRVPRITAEIEAMAGGAGSGLSRGGMRTKIDAAKIATAAGAAMVIAAGRIAHPLAAIDATGRATWFDPIRSASAARKVWIAGSLAPMGALVVDEGAAAALRDGRSLLPAGVTAVEGAFQRGDAVKIVTPSGEEIGRGLAASDAGDARLIAGQKTRTIPSILGHRGRAAMVHRDDMVLNQIEMTPEES
jgi:glutamate 5-kinase